MRKSTDVISLKRPPKSLPLDCYDHNSIRAGSVLESSPLLGPTGLVAAKNSTLIAMAKPACNANTTISRTLDVLASVVDNTGYRLLNRKVAEKARPRATKV